MGKKIYYSVSVGSYGIMIVSTIINVIYCLITSNMHRFPTSLFINFYPFYQFFKWEKTIDLIAFIVLLLVSIMIHITTIKILFFNKDNKYAFAVFIGAVWVALSIFLEAPKYWEMMTIFSGEEMMFCDLYSFIVFLLLGTSMLLKMYKKENRVNTLLPAYSTTTKAQNFEDNLVMSTKKISYIPIISQVSIFSIFLISKYYLRETNIFVAFYIIISIMSILLFLVVLRNFRKIKISGSYDNISINSLRKNIYTQIISFVIFVLSALVIFALE